MKKLSTVLVVFALLSWCWFVFRDLYYRNECRQKGGIVVTEILKATCIKTEVLEVP